MSEKLLIAGYYGFRNCGDEAILTAMLSDLRALRPHVECTVVSGSPAETVSRYGVESVHWTDLSAIFNAVRKSDLVILGGGGLFHDYWGVKLDTLLTKNHTGITYPCGFPLLAAQAGKPCMLYSVGVGPLFSEEGRALARLAFDQSDVTTVRDNESLNWIRSPGLQDAHIQVTADPAFGLTGDEQGAREVLAHLKLPRGTPHVGVCLRAWDVNIASEKWEREVAVALDRFVGAHEGSLLFVPFQSMPDLSVTDDLAVARRIIAQMRHGDRAALLSENFRPEVIAGVLAQCELVLGMRLHSLIFALTGKVAAVGVIYDPKVANLMSRLGLGEYALDLNTLDAEGLLETMASAYDHRREISTRLQPRIEEMKRLAGENARLAMELLDRPILRTKDVLDKGFVAQFALKQIQQLGVKESTASDQMKQVRESIAISDEVPTQPTPRKGDLQQLQARTPSSSRSGPLDKGNEQKLSQQSLVTSRRAGKPEDGHILEPESPLSGFGEPGSTPFPEARSSITPLNRPDVICFSIIDWEFRYQRPQQMMSQFAAHGHRVFYIRISHFLEPEAAPRVSVQTIKKNIFEITLAAKHPVDVYKKGVEGENEQELLSSLDELRHMFHIEHAIAYVMIASWANLAVATRKHWGWSVIYDCMDEWENFPGIDPVILEAERNLVQESDLVVVTAERLYRKWQGTARSVILARNAVDYDFYARELKPNTLLAGVQAPVIGYFGAIADWFDVELMSFVASHRPEYTFVLLGGVFDVDVSSLQRLSNVQLLGQQPYDLMPQYLYHFDACLIPFKINPITESTNPVKLYEYLSGGKPVVATALPELKPYAEFIYVAEDKEDFLAKLDLALKEKDEDLEVRRRHLARENAWPDRYQSIYSALSAIVPRASIIVVSHNNLIFTRLCLESVIQNTEYPGYELVVVDDNSIDGTQRYLQQLSSVNPRVIPVFNSEHLGLAHATKQGLARSTGDFIVLLNSETVVPRGWLSRVMRHLRDGGSRVIGARGECDYGAVGLGIPLPRWDEIEEFALNQSWACEGQSNEVGKLPRSCVSLSRKTFEAARSLDKDINIAEFERESFICLLKAQGIQVAEARDLFVHYSRSLIPSALRELVESRDTVKDLTDKLDEQNRALETLSTNLQNSNRQLNELQASAVETEQTINTLRLQMTEKDQTIELLTAQLVAKAAELNKMTSSLGWRLLSLYGPIKYRYLLPLYRLLRLMPRETGQVEGKKVIAATSSQAHESGLLRGSVSTDKTVFNGVSGTVSLSRKSHRDQLRVVIERVEESKGAVIFLPSVGWKIHLAQRPHHIAREYARQGYASIFVGNKLRDEENGFTEVEPNLFVYCSPEGLLRKIPDPVLWSFPYNFHEKDQYPSSAGTIYDWIDDLEVFPCSHTLLQKNHSRALEEATIVCAVSRRLHDRAVAVRPDSLYIPNGVEYRRFADELVAIPDDPAIARLKWEGKPIAGYYGALAKWFDYDLLDALAGLRPDWNFLLIGPMYDESFAEKPLLKRPNVVWIGPRQYESLPGYLKLFDVATIPFLVNDITLATSPLKLYEYFAGGKPVVTTPMPECQAYPEVHIAKDAHEFSRALDVAREEGNNPRFRERARTLAMENSWARRVATVVGQLEKKVPEVGRRKRRAIPSPSAQPPLTTRDRAEQKLGLKFTRSSRYDVICFPIIDWNFRFQRPQQLMTQFAKNGHRIFYIRTTFHQAGTSAHAQPISESIYDVQLPFPEYLNLYRDEINERACEKVLGALEELRTGARMAEVVCLVQLPFWAPLALKARDRWGWKIVYDCMDEHSGFSTNLNSMLKHEKLLISRSDLVLTTSRALFEKASRTAKRTMSLPNAADFEHFSRPGPLRPLAALRRPIIGYYGAISDWFDVEMVRSAAARRTDWQFVLVGSTFGADVKPLKRLSNVHLLGEQPYATLPGYLHEFDVACIPFLVSPLTQATNPVKFYEYLSAGKPVVAVELPELMAYRNYFYPVPSREDFVPQIEIALKEESKEMVNARIDFARQNTWPDRFKKLSVAVQELYGKVAIVIVSYDNPKCLRLCLESIWTRTTYPNFEVIVVDNGSGPELVEYLQASARQEPRLKIILNGRNLGFARANNIGIRAAGECDYIVLLNDDTVVAGGWLGRMIEYLRDDEMGIIGPVTNWIGNEAKIAVDYQSIADMEGFAERHMSEHEGRSFDIPMLAMFCIGMRKSLLDKIGLLDEQYGIGMFEDDDFALRVREAGYRVVCAEDIFVHHWGQASFKKLGHENYLRLFEENRQKFEEKWKKEWKPHQYRPGNVTAEGGKFSIEA